MRKILLLCLTALCTLVTQGLWAQTYQVTMTPENNGYVTPGTQVSSITFACDDGIQFTTGYDSSYGGGGDWYFYIYDESENPVAYADFYSTSIDGGTDSPETKDGINISYTFPLYASYEDAVAGVTTSLTVNGTYHAYIPQNFYYLGPNYTQGNEAFTYTFTIGTASETGFTPKFSNVVLESNNDGYNGLTVDITTQAGGTLSRNADSSVRASITGDNGLEYIGYIYTPDSKTPETWSIYFYGYNDEEKQTTAPVNITEEGTYTVTFPAEYFKETADETSLSAESSFTFTIGETTSDDTGVEMEYDPADQAQLTSLDKITVTNGDTGLMWDGEAYSLDDLVITNTQTSETYTAIEIEDEGLSDYGAEAQIIHFNKIVKEGTYTITIPAGAFWSGQSDNHNAAATLTYYIDGTEDTGDTNTFEATITTEDATTTGVTLIFEEEVTLVGTEDLSVTCGTQSTTASITETGTSTTWTLTFASELTISGTYTIEIPEGYFTNSEEQDIEATTAKFTVSIAIEEPTEGTPGSISWPFNEVSLDENTATIEDNLRGAVTSTVSLGSNISYYGYQEKYNPETDLNYHLAELSRRSITNSNVDDNSIDFIINITDGCEFTPTAISMQADIVDQTGYVLDVTWIGSNQTIDIASETFPERNTFITGEYGWEDIYAQPSTSQCKLRFTLSGNTGTFFLGNINITGIVEGEFQRTFTLILDPASGSVIEKLESITVSHEDEDEEMTLAGDGKFEIQDKEGNVVAYAQSSSSATDRVYTLTIEDTNNALETPGTYTLIIPQGSYSSSDAVNEKTEAKYIVPDYFTLTFDPPAGKVTSLEYISVSCDGGLQFAIDPTNDEEAAIKLTASDGTEYTMYPSPTITNGVAMFDIENSNSSEVELTNPGTYTFTMPAGYFYDSAGTAINEESIVEYIIPSITITMDTDEAELSEEGTSLTLTITAKDEDEEDVDFQVAQSDEMITITTPSEEEDEDDVLVAYATAEQDEVTGKWTLSFVDAEDGVTPVAITNDGTYTITIPTGYFATEDGIINTKATATFTIGEETEPGPVEEGLLYSTDFTEWETIDRTEANGDQVTVTTTTGGELTFTLWGVGVDPTKTDESKFPDYVGTMITSKYPSEYAAYEPYALTSTLGTLDKIEFIQVATGNTRGIKISVMGDEDDDWVAIHNQTISNAKGETVTLDNLGRTNCRIKIEGFNLEQNGYIADLKIYGTDGNGTEPEATDTELYDELKLRADTLGVYLEYTWMDLILQYPEETIAGLQSTYEEIYKEVNDIINSVGASHCLDNLAKDEASIIANIETVSEEIANLYVLAAGIKGITIDDLEAIGAKGIYTITGQKVSTPTKAGIYIIDGKKVVIK